MAIRRDRPRRHEDPGGRHRRAAQGARPGAPADAHRGWPGGRGEGDGGDPARSRQGRRARAGGAEGDRRRIAGRDRRRQREQRPQPARLGRHIRVLPRRSKARSGSASRSRSATTCRSRPTPSSSWAPGGPTSSLLGVFWGTGVGGGLILDGKPWLGRGGAGEIGHMVVKIDGARCTCGRRGCVEAYAGRAAMEDPGAQAPREGQARPTCSS